MTSPAHPASVGAALEYCHAALQSSAAYYGHGTDNAWDEAVQLVLSAMGLPVHAGDEVLSVNVEERQWQRIESLLQKRITERIPLPYLLGRAWFAGLEFRCDQRAIVPRSPLAELIANGFAPWYSGPAPRRILDLCCGGGCIGLAAAHYFPDVRVDLVDLDEAALSLARENAALLELTGRTRILRSDLFQAVAEQRYDLILCNPPYVDEQDLAAMPAEFACEPELSLGSGPDGLDATRKILAAAGEFLEPHGLLIVEVGYTWPALEAAYPDVPFTWVEFEHGGEGVFVLTAREWQDYSACFVE